MTKLLIAAFQPTGSAYVEAGIRQGMDVRVLDCLNAYHKQLNALYGDSILHTHGRKADVIARVAEEEFDVAIIQEDSDFVQTALITQTLRNAGIPSVIVVTEDPLKRAMYRRCGAHHIIAQDNPQQAWALIQKYLPTCLPA